ncbi:PQQ-dependent sugar dehydrogenase [Algoriphagus terrigena]|uniref:PQQ-dependent sugar dehydrogenase n=1 Tax=Algoriphagus terrigena TaxID=344884 RepID=UPI0004009523|nr:PQQ-dependent sugar dehydrogenase [Algoriphagus terrigena]
MKNALFLVLATSLLIFSCNSEKSEFGSEISTDTEQIAKGKQLFEQNCSSCHNFLQTTIGPNLSGLTRSVDSRWISEFVKHPIEVIDGGDERGAALFAKFKIYMPGFPQLKEDDLDAILSYLHTYTTLPDTTSLAGLANPIVDSVSDSGIRLDLEFVMQIPPSDTVPPLAKITKLESEPATGRTFLNDQRGVLYEFKGNKYHEYLPIRDLMPNILFKPGLATGLGSYAFHPEFAENGIFYTGHSEKGNAAPADYAYPDSVKVFLQWVLTEWKANDPMAGKFEGTSRELLRINFVTQIHGMQEVTFNPNAKKGDPDYSMLYIGIGDGGSAESGFAYICDHQGRDIWSSILRIDPAGRNSKNGKYGIPSDNPFVGQAGKAQEVFAYGFRNPNRILWDLQGRLLASDIGHKNVEELNLIESGKFYGWPNREGTFVIDPYKDMDQVFALPADDAKLGVTYPFLQLDHDEIAAIIAGYFVQKGTHKGKLLFGDVPSGRLMIADLTDHQNIKVESWKVRYQGKEMDLKELCGNNRVDLKFGQDKSGQLYLMTKADGKVYKIKGT